MGVDENNVKLPKSNEVVSSKHNSYEVIKLLGRGGFGAVYMVKRLSDNQMLAMKCEIIENERPTKVLMMDCKVLQGASSINSPHFCTIIDRGKITDCFNYLIMTLLGPNLWDLRINRDSQKFSIGTSLITALQCLMAIEDLHHVGFLHRDIKPGNYCIGLHETDNFHVVYMLDFGLCRKYLGDNGNKDLRIPRISAPFRGTTRYASIAALSEQEQSRKDDIEAWMYMVIEWTVGSLPWRYLTGKRKLEVLAWKTSIRDDANCMDQFLTGCPAREFKSIFFHVYGLNYANIPDYSYCYYCIMHAFRENNCNVTDPPDWDAQTPYHGPTLDDRNKRVELFAKDISLNEEKKT